MILSEKHKAAADHLLLDLADGTCGCGECRDIIAAALAKAERDGMKRAAEIATEYAGEYGPLNEFDDDGYWRETAALTVAAAILSEAGEE